MSEEVQNAFFDEFEKSYPGLKRAKNKPYALMALKPKAEIALAVKKKSVKVEISSLGGDDALSADALTSWAKRNDILKRKIAGQSFEVAAGVRNENKLSVAIEIPLESEDDIGAATLQADVDMAIDIIWKNLGDLQEVKNGKIHEELYRKLESIWAEEFNSSDAENILWPLVPMQPTTDGILFVGMNPSFSDKGFDKWFKKRKIAGRPEDFYAWRNQSAFDRHEDVCHQNWVRSEYPYFKRFGLIAMSLGLPWDHVDLFFWRETNQKSFSKLVLKREKDPIKLEKFGIEQLKISCELIEVAKPKCVVVVNALASRIYKRYHGASIEFCSENGCYFQWIADRRVPLFLCSMLTGQRALDCFSFERLEWHLAKVLQVNYKGLCRVREKLMHRYKELSASD